MGLVIKVNYTEAKDKELEDRSGLMDLCMRECGTKIKRAEKED